jgi:hypothetical protein
LHAEEDFSVKDFENKGKDLAKKLLSSGGDELMKQIKANLPG